MKVRNELGFCLPEHIPFHGKERAIGLEADRMSKRHLWYVTEDRGLLLFDEEEKLTEAQWRERATRREILELEKDLREHPELVVAEP
jgi:hypothetical protein